MKISVVIPLYNKAHTIVRTLSTVLAQTFRDFEVVIVNDGSTDNGVDVIHKNFDDLRIRIVQQPNCGVSAARNRGIKEAKGEYVAFLDGDDLWMPNYLERIIEAIAKYPDAYIFGAASYNKNEATGEIHAHAIIDKYYGKISIINYFLNPDKMTHICATTIERNRLLENGGFDSKLRVNEDFLLLGQMAMDKIVYIGDCLHVYVGGIAGQATSLRGNRKNDFSNSLYVINHLMQKYRESGKTNKLVPISMGYRSKHLLIGAIRNKEDELVSYWFDNIDSALVPRVMKLMAHSPLLLNLYILITKVWWRLHGYPRVGTKSRYNAELVKRYQDIFDI